MDQPGNALDLLNDLIGRAKAAGADAADAVAVDGTSISHARRLGKLEKLDRAEGRDLGLRVFVGKRQAIVSSSDRSASALKELVERAVAMARAAPEDPFCGLAEPGDIARTLPDLDMIDPVEPPTDTLIARASAAEEAAMAVAGVTNSEGAEASWSRSNVALAATNGFSAAYGRSSHSISASVIAGEGTGMERDYDYSSVIHGADLESPAAVGKREIGRAHV